MAQRNYQEYAQSPTGKAARAKAHAKYIDKRRHGSDMPWRINPQPLERVLWHWNRT